MKKLFKRIAAVCMAAIMMTSLFGTIAFAEGTAAYAQPESADSVNLQFNFENVGSSETTLGGLRINTAGSYKITFGGALGSPTRVSFVNVDTSASFGFTIPKYISGMPATLTTYIDLPSGNYWVKVKSDGGSNTTTTGHFTIYGVELP